MVLLAGQDQRGARDVRDRCGETGVAFRQHAVDFRIDLGVVRRHPLPHPVQHVRVGRREAVGEPAGQRGVDGRGRALFVCDGQPFAHRRALVVGPVMRRVQDRDGRAAAGMGEREGAHDQPAERKPRDGGARDAEMVEQLAELADEVLHLVAARARRALAMAEQVVTDDREPFPQRRKLPVPHVAGQSYAVDQRDRRAGPRDRIGGAVGCLVGHGRSSHLRSLARIWRAGRPARTLI